MRIRLLNCLQMMMALFALALVVGCERGNEDDGTKPGGEDNTPKAFTFENIRKEHTTIHLDILPEDKASEYIVFISEVKHFQANRINTAEELFEDDHLYFREMATEYNMTMHEFLTRVGWLTTGDKLNYGAINLYPATDYIVYCYGVEFEDDDHYTATTDVCYTLITTTAPEFVDAEFSITPEVNGNVVTIELDPNGYDGLYYHYIIDETDLFYLREGMEFNDEYIAHYRNLAFDEFNERINDEGYAPDMFCHRGAVTFRERLNANTAYMVLSFAVSDERMPLLCSTPSVAYFATGEPLLTEISIDIEVDNITPYSAYLTITPSNNDPYACVFLSKDQMPNTGDEMSDMEIIIEYYMPAILTGPHYEELTPLMPATDYIVVAFGIEDDLPASQMFSYEFTSGDATKGNVNITDIELLKVYDARAILKLEPSYGKLIGEAECVAIVEAETSAPTDTLYFWWYEEWHKLEYNDEVFLEDLLMYDPANNPEVMQMWYSMDENDKFFFAGIAEDENGNLGDIYYGESFLLTEDMVSPAEEFIAWMAEPEKQGCVATFARR